jgi:hypothetical protein
MIKRIIIPVGYGGASNQVFQIYHWFPVAIKKNIPIYFPGFKKYANLYVGTKGNNIPRYPINAPDLPFGIILFIRLSKILNRISPKLFTKFMRFLENSDANFFNELDDNGMDGSLNPNYIFESDNIHNSKTIWIKGWLYRDSEGVAMFRKEIQDYFSPDYNTLNQVNKFIKKAKTDIDLLVGVHLRRADYKKFNGGKFFYSDSEMNKKMREVEKIFQSKKVRFLIVSDEQINLSNYAGISVMLGLGYAMGDLFSLANCDYMIAPPSTFSTWASWYNKVPRYIIKDISQPITIDQFKPALD